MGQGMRVQIGAMTSRARTFRRVCAAALPALAVLTLAATPLRAAPCAFEPQGEGHVTEITSGNSFRLSDGREIRLAGIEPYSSDMTRAGRAAALSSIIADKDVTLRGADDAPDRYGRQSAFAFLRDNDTPVQSELLAAGAALVSAEIADKDCAAMLAAAEAAAHAAKKGIWASPAAIKNAESADDILAGIGRFTLVEGKVLSVRQAGATTYLNFGRRWTRDFAVTISRRMLPAVEAAGVAVKSLENRRILVRGWVEAHPGPRIEVVRGGQIEVLGGN
jgi:endonuclease YncB( thermonuclease family)